MNIGFRQYHFFNFKLICLSTILLTLPFSYRVSNLVMIFLLGFAIYQIVSKKTPVVFISKISFWIPSFFFIIALIGLIYSENLENGYRATERQLPLIILPFIITQLGISRNEFYNLKRLFIGNITLIILVLEVRTLWLLLNNPEHDFFTYFFSYYHTYENITTTFLAQPAYFGVFVVISNIFCLTFIVDENKTKAKNKIYLSLIILLNTFFLAQLAARSSILMNVGVILFCISYNAYRSKKYIFGAFAVISILCLFGLLFSGTGFSKLRMQWVLDEMKSDNIKIADPQSRLLIWPLAVEVIKDNWIFGVGTGDSEDSLVDLYKSNNLHELYESQLNAHNQYLTSIMRNGLLGLLVLVLNIVVPLGIYIIHGKIEALLFIFLVAGFFLTENVLGRAQGVIFFSFFHSIYLSKILDDLGYENIGLRYKLFS